MASTGAKLRAAVYTRKSTEEGLDQAFNSLDAQREACAAYVLSQQHEGWTLLPDYYDDGGFSGGNLDRPALRRLLADVKEGKVDIVVVYKIDRLTRSLTDFAKIVDVLDAAETSFVSVTQAFSTTNSMGRLTLNVLLSFAQFEREVIAERVRDKVAASKAKGMWMGGNIPLGYEVKDRKLVVVPAEAATVRTIMERYVKSGSVRELLVELHRDGIVSKRRISRSGVARGGLPFGRGALYHLLANRTYLGQTHYKGTIYDGEHDAIVSEELFASVQARLAERTTPNSPNRSRKIVSLLAGMIRDHRDRPMSPAHTQNHGRRYRYYSSHMGDDQSAPAIRLPAGELDAAVRQELAKLLADTDRMRALVEDPTTAELNDFISHCSTISQSVTAATVPELRSTLKALDLRVTATPSEITASFDGAMLMAQAEINASCAQRIEFTIPTHQASFGHELRLRLDPQSGTPNRSDRSLIDALARSFAAREQLLAMTSQDVAEMPKTRLRHLERIARLSYLDPSIVRMVLDGTAPANLSARSLWRLNALPVSWREQRGELIAAQS